MKGSLAVKKNLSSIQVLKTLKQLLRGNYTMAELVDNLNTDEDEAIFNNSTVSKYINTCRAIGIDIPKIQNRYFVASLPFGLDISLKEVDLINLLRDMVKKFFTKTSEKKFDEFIEKLSKYSNRNIYRVSAGNESGVRDKFENAVQENRKIRLMFRSNEIIECIPSDMVYVKGKLYFKVTCAGNEKLYAVDRITGLEVLNTRYLPVNEENNAVVYKLKGNLAKRYQMRENEKELGRNEDSVTISNVGESREILYSRLLRYDSLCEILEPSVCREDMIKIINKALSNYGV